MNVHSNLLILIVIITFNLIPFSTNAQELANLEEDRDFSVRNEHANFYRQFGEIDEEKADSVQFNVLDHLRSAFTPRHARKLGCRLSKKVYGYHPSWLGASHYNNYDFSLLSTFCYFSYDLDPVTGAYKSIHSWKTTNAINLAKNAGCRVELCVTNFGGSRNNRFLSNRRAWERFTNNIIELLAYRDADGVNIDFEGVRRSDKHKLTAFMLYLSNRLKRARPGSTVTMALPALNSYQTYDVAKLEPYVDLFIIMGYDYHYSKSKHAGPVSPLNGYLSIRSTINNYVNTGVSRSKLILAVPYYGREWRTKSSTVPSNTRHYIKAPTYSQIKGKTYRGYAERWHENSATPYLLRVRKGVVKQCWFDSKQSLGQKYDLTIQRGLGGVGIWALGYDNGHSELWSLLEEKFVSCNQDNYPSSQPNATYSKPLADILEVIFKASSNYRSAQ